MNVSNIEAVRARAALPSNCSNCGCLSVFVMESRVTATARRRRKRCDKCGHRETTYEISQDLYKSLIKGSPRPAAPTAPGPQVSCSRCIHWESSSCGFDFPEAGGYFAGSCSCFTEAAA